MSFLIETVVRRAAAVPAPLARSAAVGVARTRPFTTTRVAPKSATETVKEGIHKVDRTVSDKLVDGINAGAAAADKAKHVSEDIVGKSSGKASELQGEAAGKASELKGEAAGKASELKGKAQGTVDEAAGKAKGAAEEVKKNL